MSLEDSDVHDDFKEYSSFGSPIDLASSDECRLARAARSVYIVDAGSGALSAKMATAAPGATNRRDFTGLATGDLLLGKFLELATTGGTTNVAKVRVGW